MILTARVKMNTSLSNSRLRTKFPLDIWIIKKLNHKENSRSYNGHNELKIKRDMVNYEVLKGHKYEIIENPDKEKCPNKRLYLCKYDNWERVFTKTWNLVSHFRTHTSEEPYQCPNWFKQFSQLSNWSRHINIHCSKKMTDDQVYSWSKCSKKYSSKYNLNVRLYFDFGIKFYASLMLATRVWVLPLHQHG